MIDVHILTAKFFRDIFRKIRFCGKKMFPQNLTNDADIDALKPCDDYYKKSVGKSLFILVMPSGSKYWRLRYRIEGKEKSLALGVFPEINFATA